MAFIEIQFSNGDAERRELKKQTPITIGRHVSNDVAIDEPEVAVMHCRISWVKGGFEAVAASGQPLDVNGTPRQRAELKPGDILRFGSVDVRFHEKEVIEPAPRPRVQAPAPPKPAAPLPAVDPFERDAPRVEEVQKSPEKVRPETNRPVIAATPTRSVPVESSGPATAAKKSDETVLSDRVRRAMRSQQTRPGEEDSLRSPLVLGLSIGAAVLLLTGAIFYFIATRQTTQQAFAVARQSYDEGNFRASIDALQKFIIAYPRQPLTVEAQRLLGLSKVRQLIEGGAPRYPEGLEELRTFVDEQKDLDGFESLHSEILNHAKTISLGAAEMAGKLYDPKMLEVSDQARTLLKTYAPKNAPPTETLAQIEQAQRASLSLIMRDDVYKEHLDAIDTALTKNDPLQAMQLRRNLLVRYPQFDRDKKIVDRMQKMLAAERGRAVFAELNQAAETTDHAWPPDVLTLGFLGRTRTDEVAVGQVLVMLAQDSCYGLEMVTGQPLWRRVIGFNTPFFPISEANQPNIILFDTVFQEIVRLNRNTGQFLWRLPIHDDLSGKPLLNSDTLYVPTRGGKLLTIAVATGQLTGSLTFSQSVGGAVELGDGQRMVVAGNREVLYMLTMRPFACTGVFDLGQPAGSIQAPLITAASYLLAIENGNNRATLQLLNVGAGEQEIRAVTSATINGRVIDQPVLRGRDLFIPSTGEQVSTFSLSDDSGQPPLTAGPVYVSEGKQSGSAYLLTGPDRQLWMATAALNRLRLTTDALQLDGEPIGIGIATQPLQYLSGFLFHARRRPLTGAVTMTRTDRDEMKSDWQTILGSPIAAWTSSTEENSSLCAVTDAGQTYRTTARQVSGLKFLMEPGARLPIPPELRSPVQIAAVTNNRIAVAAGGAEPRQWLINPAGQIESTGLLPQAPQAPPCGLGGATLFPLSGMMHVIRPAGQPAVQAFTFPSHETHQWVSVSQVGENLAAGVTSKGLVILLRLNSDPQPHLGEVARIELGATLEYPAQAVGNVLAVVDQSQTVSLFDGERLELRGKRRFDRPLSHSPRMANGLLFVEESQSQLHALEPTGELASRWSIPLKNTSVTGVLQQQEQCVIALQNGDVLFVDPANGTVVSKVETRNALATGPLLSGGSVFVGTADGSMVKVR